MLQAGFARVDVTPPLGSYLAGYFESRYADGVLDPIQLNAIAMGNGEDRVLIITSDFVHIRERYATKIRKLISDRIGLDPDRIMVTALHTHTSITLREMPCNNVMDDYGYMQLLYRKFADVAEMAVDDMTDAVMSYGEDACEKEISFVRRYILKDGTVKTNPYEKKYIGQIIGRAEDADNTVRLVKLSREGKKDIALVNFATHPDVIGGTKYSADWPGFVRRFVEEDHEDAHCILINGFQGDANHVDYMLPNEEDRYPCGIGYSHSEYMGRQIANTVNKLWNDTSRTGSDTVGGCVSNIYNKTRNDKEEYFDECLELYERRELYEDYSSSQTRSGIDMAEAYRVVRMRTESMMYEKISVTVFRVGDIGIVGLGGEPFTNYANALRSNFSGKKILTSCNANGSQGYLPTVKAFEQGGYETMSSPFSPDTEAKCVAEATELLKKLEL